MTDMMKEFGFSSGDPDGSASVYPQVLKLKATTGEWALRVVDGEGQGSWKPVDLPKQLAVDMPNFRKGYNHIAAGQKPDERLVHYSDVMPEKPSENHKPTFSVNVYSKHLDYCVFSSQSLCVIRKMNELLQAYINGRPDEVKVPVCTVDMEEIVLQTGTISVPTFTIVKYIDRPANLIAPRDNTVEIKSKPPQEPKVATPPEFDDEIPFDSGEDDNEF
jgi:hypothetical protein